MRKHLSLVLLGTACLGITEINAQNWVVGGNTLAADGRLGTNNAYALVFETNNSERGRITNGGIWSIGTSPKTSKFTVNSAAGQHAFRVMVAEATKLIVNSNGGTTIGGSTTVGPANGLYVAGSVGIGTATPSYKLHVAGNASITNGLYVGAGGIYGYGGATNSLGVYGSGSNYGLYGNSPGTGVYGNSSNYGYGVWGNSGAYGVYGTGGTYGVWGKSTGGWGVYGQSSSSVGVGGTSGTNYGVYGSSSNYPGIYGRSSNHYGIEAHGGSSTWAATAYGGYGGVYGTGVTYGVYGNSSSGRGVYGISSSNYGGQFYSTSNYGLVAQTGASGGWAGVFYGKVFASAGYTTSDKKLKKGIEDFTDALNIINKLKPRNYEFRQDGEFASIGLPQGKHYGLVAQELEEVLPNLISEVDIEISDKSNGQVSPKPTITPSDQNSGVPSTQLNQTGTQQTSAEQSPEVKKMTIKSVNYLELIPILVKGMQELSEENKNLRQELNELKLLMTKVTLGQDNSTSTRLGSLLQNIPNPANTATSIKYSLPEGSIGAQLLITDALGRSIKQMTLSTSGVINLDVSALASGVYNYSIIANGKIVDTKKMTVLR